jgi:hypothetical protein
MNPKGPIDVETQLEQLGARLRQHPGLTDRVMHEIRKSAEANRDDAGTVPLWRRDWMPHRWRLFSTAAAAAILAVGITWGLGFFADSTWAEVIKAMQSQKWIHATMTTGGNMEMWLSPEHQIWAFKDHDHVQFSDARQRAKYEFWRSRHEMSKFPLGEEDIAHVMPMEDIAGGNRGIGPWLFGEKIVGQTRREVTADGKQWIEFDLTFWRGAANHGILRVDPATKLPVYHVLTSPRDGKPVVRWEFDYPQNGPSDIYALGVPADTKIGDLTPSDEGLRVLDGIAAGRARIGDFKFIVATHPGYPSWIVWRKKDRWRIDVCLPSPECSSTDVPHAQQSWRDWWQERLKLCRTIPEYICDGQTVYENRSLMGDDTSIKWQLARSVAPQDLLSGNRSNALPLPVAINRMLFPDLTPRSGFSFDYDPNPEDADGCVLVKVSARLASTEPLVGHEWYFVDPQKGYAVVRQELFNLPPGVSPEPSHSKTHTTVRMEEFQSSPDGFLYPTIITTDSEMPQRKGIQLTWRYDFDFQVDFPDSLFTVDTHAAP